MASAQRVEASDAAIIVAAFANCPKDLVIA
jgi:hypothetical protein